MQEIRSSLLNLFMLKCIGFTSSQIVIIIWPYIGAQEFSVMTVSTSACVDSYRISSLAFAILWANYGGVDATCDRKAHPPVHAEDRVAIVHEVHIHFLNVFVLHHAEGEEIHTWKRQVFIYFYISMSCIEYCEIAGRGATWLHTSFVDSLCGV